MTDELNAEKIIENIEQYGSANGPEGGPPEELQEIAPKDLAGMVTSDHLGYINQTEPQMTHLQK